MPATRAEIASATTLAQLQHLAKKHGYSMGWAQRVYTARSKKNDGIYGGGTPSKKVGGQTQSGVHKTKRAGEQGVAGQAFLSAHYTVLD